MAPGGIGRRLLAAVSRHVLRVAGFVMVAASVGVTATSLATARGVGPFDGGEAQRAAALADGTVGTALVEFSLAHPAYPAATLVGLALVVLGEDAPLLG